MIEAREILKLLLPKMNEFAVRKKPFFLSSPPLREQAENFSSMVRRGESRRARAISRLRDSVRKGSACDVELEGSLMIEAREMLK